MKLIINFVQWSFSALSAFAQMFDELNKMEAKIYLKRLVTLKVFDKTNVIVIENITVKYHVNVVSIIKNGIIDDAKKLLNIASNVDEVAMQKMNVEMYLPRLKY